MRDKVQPHANQGGSARAGYLLPATASQKLDLYGQYLWSHQDGDTVHLITGETVKFKDVNSPRLGAKWHLALEQNASIYGYALDTTKLKGDSTATSSAPSAS
ncbi:hypothetical protein AGMMS50225_05080 [Betaproteobacteria bacterium]|nr:hypothetical protein AGMMS50225_05080 [Betaproteobacteria bacterium]